MLKVYAYQNCDTCRKAMKFLQSNGVAHKVIAIRETPPTVGELKLMLKAYEGNLRRLFNTSGGDYKTLGLKERMSDMSEAEAFELLSANGNLVKRPFVIGPYIHLIGFDEEGWKEAFGTGGKTGGMAAG